MIHEPEILLIGRDDPSLKALTQQLLQAGYAVSACMQAEQALSRLQAHPYKLVILVINLPGESALSTIQQLRQPQALHHIPIIIAAPVDQSTQAEPLLAAGADDYLLLPVSISLLRVRLDIWLKRLPTNQEHHALLAYERDLQIGHQIQAGFLPESLPQVDGWEIAARFQPARKVAGDFYDAFMLTQNRRLGFVLADVCDKGVGAALFMALFRSLIRAFAQQHHTMSWANVLNERLTGTPRQRPPPPQQRVSIGVSALQNAVGMTNAYMVENHRRARMYATLFFGVLDPATGALLYVNGGHNPPVLIGAQGIKAQLEPTGPVVGIFPGATFGIQQVQLEPDDVLFCYTDGVVDAKNASGEFFTEERMLALALQPAPSADTLLERIATSLRDHIADTPQFDDITLLAVRRKPGSIMKSAKSIA